MIALFLAVVSVALGTGTGAASTCGTKELYGKTLTLHAMNVPCAEVERITAGECDVDGQPWLCSSSHVPGPALYWHQDTERFAREPSTWIEARRPPCSHSRVTAAGWDRARKRLDDPFPTELQLLTDDLIRCKQLRRKSRAAVLKVLRGGGVGRRSLSWLIGPERTLSPPIPNDGEYLTIVFNRKGQVRSVTIEQI